MLLNRRASAAYDKGMAVRQGITVEEYLALPERRPWLEYDEGEVCAKVPPDFFHTAISGRVDRALGRHTDRAGGFYGPEGRVELRRQGKPIRYYLPDVAYWAPGRPIRGPRAMHPPTLTVEVMSPGQSLARARRKCRRFVEGGVAVAWLIDPRRQVVEVFDAEHDAFEVAEGVLRHAALPGFTLAVEAIFEGLEDEPIVE